MSLDLSKYNSLREFSFPHMNSLVNLKKPIYKSDGLGGIEEEWHDEGKAWAKIMPMSNFKNTDLYRKKANVLIIMRHDPDISPDMRIISGNLVYDIENITNIETRFIIISAAEGNHYA